MGSTSAGSKARRINEPLSPNELGERGFLEIYADKIEFSEMFILTRFL